MPIIGQFGSLAGLGSLMLPGGAMESIATVTVGSGGASSISFSDIPGGFQHLQIRLLSKWTTTSGAYSSIVTQFNGDTGSNYAYHLIYGNGTSALTSSGATKTFGLAGWALDSSATTANMFSASIVDILDYANTSKNKTMRLLHGQDANTNNSTYGAVGVWSSLWMSTSAITSIALSFASGNFAQYSQASLYGLRA